MRRDPAVIVADAGWTGLLVPPGDADALAGALTRLLDRPDEADRMGRAGWARVRAQHDPEGHVAALQEVYRRVAR